MTAIVFAGPTISSEDVQSICPCRCLPPASRGDVYRAALTRPIAIGIVDGYFQGALSIWHKEILWAMSQGIHVFGCSSMGALRAAELHQYGMRGVGRIFQDYRDGILMDDDEVAVQHGPLETGFLTLSEPMVNIRATLERAVVEGIVGPDDRDALCGVAKSLFYHHRSFQAVLDSDVAKALTLTRHQALERWLVNGRIDQKRDDAVEMLSELQAFVSAGPEPMIVDYAFEWTHLWDDVTTEFAANMQQDGSDYTGKVSTDQLLDEFRVDPDFFHRLRQLGLLRLLALKESYRRHHELDGRALRRRMKSFRVANQLFTRQSLDRWLIANSLDDDGLDQLIEQDARIAALSAEAARELEFHMISAARSSGEFAAFLQRATSKREALEEAGLMDVEPANVGLSKAHLVAWYFEVHLDRPIPENLDEYIEDLGFPDMDRFHGFLAREFSFTSRSK